MHIKTTSIFSTAISDIVPTSYDDDSSQRDGLHDMLSFTVGSSVTMTTMMTETTPPLLTKGSSGKAQTYAIVAIGLLFNGISLVVFTKTGCNRRRNAPVMLITALAWIDSLAILCYVGRAGLKPILRIDLPQVDCNLFGFITNFFPFASGLVVMLMSIERYTALLTPYRYHQRFTERRATCGVVGLICVAALIGALPFFGIGSYQRVPFHGQLMCKLFWLPGDSLASTAQFVIYATCGWGLLLTVIACNVSVILEVIKMRRKITRLYPGLKHIPGVEEKFVKTTFFVTLLFISCWLPWMLFVTYTRIGTKTRLGSDLIAHRILLANHALDPVVSLLVRFSVGTRLRQVFRRFSCRLYRVDPEFDPKARRSEVKDDPVVTSARHTMFSIAYTIKGEV